MATDIKVVVRDGQYGLILHKHGNSAWHPANEVHSGKLGRSDKDNDEQSHSTHAASAKAVLDKLASFADPSKAFSFTHEGETVQVPLTAEYLLAEYKAALEGTSQLFWYAAWRNKLAARKAKKEAEEAAEEEKEEALA